MHVVEVHPEMEIETVNVSSDFKPCISYHCLYITVYPHITDRKVTLRCIQGQLQFSDLIHI